MKNVKLKKVGISLFIQEFTKSVLGSKSIPQVIYCRLLAVTNYLLCFFLTYEIELKNFHFWLSNIFITKN